MAKPRLLLLDEPSLGLAPVIVPGGIPDHLGVRRHTTCLAVEQNARMGLSVADHGYVLETGRIVLGGKPDELLGDEASPRRLSRWPHQGKRLADSKLMQRVLVTVQVPNLIDFVAEVFTIRTFRRRSPAHRDLSDDRKPDRTRQPRRDPGARLYPVEEDGLGRSRPDRRARGRYAVAGGGRWQVRLRADRRAQAVRIGIEKCKAIGLAAVALRNAGHIGRVGDWAEMAAAEGLVSIHFVNAAGSVLVAPYGGVERRLSTAPYCVGIPRQGQAPIVLDFATSIVAEGKVLVASRGGKKLPKGALIDLDGTLSEDPAVLYGPHSADGPRDHSQGKGAIRAFGEHKGSGLALICELLGGALTGTGATGPNRRFANGMFAVYVDPKVVDPANFFDGEISRYIAYLQGHQAGRRHRCRADPGRAGGQDARRAHQKWRALAGRYLGRDVNTARDVGVQRVEHPEGQTLRVIALSLQRARQRSGPMAPRTVTGVSCDGSGRKHDGQQSQGNMGVGQSRGERLACDSFRFSAEVIAQCGFDSVTVDMQHGVQDYQSMVQCFQAMHGHPVTPMVRVPWNEPGIIGKVLDGGAYGVICPMINTRQEAENLVAYCKYPPRGTRSNGPIRAGMYGSAGTYQQTANDEIVLLPMMETKTAIENMESILDVEGINGVYIGPSDLGFSYGLVPKLDREEPEILKIYEKIVKECGKRGLYPGIHCCGADRRDERDQHGLQARDPVERQRVDGDLRQDADRADPEDSTARRDASPDAHAKARSAVDRERSVLLRRCAPLRRAIEVARRTSEGDIP